MNINIFIIFLFFTFSKNKKINKGHIFSKFPSYDKSLVIHTYETKNLKFDSIEVTILNQKFDLLFCLDFFSFFSPNIKSTQSVSETEKFDINGKKIKLKYKSYYSDLKIKDLFNDDIKVNGFQIEKNNFTKEIDVDKNFSIVGLNHDQFNINSFLTVLQNQNLINYGSLVYKKIGEIIFGDYPDEFREDKTNNLILTCQSKKIISIGWSCNSQYLVFGDFDFSTKDNWNKQSKKINHIITFTSLVYYHIFPFDLYEIFKNSLNCNDSEEEDFLILNCNKENLKRFGIVINGTLLEFKHDFILDDDKLKIKFTKNIDYKYIQLSVKLLINSTHEILFDDFYENIKIVNNDLINVSNYTGYEKNYKKKIHNIIGLIVTLFIIIILGIIFKLKKTWKEKTNIPSIPNNYLRIFPKIVISNNPLINN